MRRAILTLSLLLPLGACYVEPPPPVGYGYQQPPPAAYPPPAPYGYGAYPGYSYNDGAPIIVEGGVPVPLIFFGGAWGWYDGGHVWHRAPDPVMRDLDARRAGGAAFHPSAVPQAQGWQHEQAVQHYDTYRQGWQQTPGGYHPPPASQPHEEHRGHECSPGQHC